MAIFDEYNVNPDQNQLPPPQGAPEGNFKGRDVNNVLRRMMAAIAELRETVLFRHTGSAPKAQAGTIAGQNFNNVNIVGGFIHPSTVAGVIPVGCILPYWGLVSNVSPALQPFWTICDGRTVNGITTPPLMQQVDYVRWGAVVERGGNSSTVTGLAGNHNHGGTTTASPLSQNQLPNHNITVGAKFFTPNANGDIALVPLGVGGSGPFQIFNIGANEAHAHGIQADGNHGHNVTVVPPYVTLIPLMRTG